MDRARGPADDLLDVARALLLLQGAILVATTIDALVWATVFPGASGSPVLISGASALVILVGRIRLRADRRRTRWLVYLVEGFILLTAAADIVIALLLSGALPPMVALLTRVVLPIALVVLLRRSARRPRTPATPTIPVPEAAS